MTTPSPSPAALVRAILTTTENAIIPLTSAGVQSGSKLFGAAILRKADLAAHTVATNNERLSPLLHGEINCIQEFFTNPQYDTPAQPRPDPGTCVFFATHEPCSLCLSGIAWAGFREFYYLFTYEDSRDLFGIPYDIDILQEVYKVKAEGETEESLGRRALYNRKNKFFEGRSLAELVSQVEDEGERNLLKGEIDRIKAKYNALSETYQEGKQKGVATASVWQ
ncbi:unnamed protein product [Discula destructiva]